MWNRRVAEQLMNMHTFAPLLFVLQVIKQTKTCYPDFLSAHMWKAVSRALLSERMSINTIIWAATWPMPNLTLLLFASNTCSGKKLHGPKFHYIVYQQINNIGLVNMATEAAAGDARLTPSACEWLRLRIYNIHRIIYGVFILLFFLLRLCSAYATTAQETQAVADDQGVLHSNLAMQRGLFTVAANFMATTLFVLCVLLFLAPRIALERGFLLDCTFPNCWPCWLLIHPIAISEHFLYFYFVVGCDRMGKGFLLSTWHSWLFSNALENSHGSMKNAHWN